MEEDAFALAALHHKERRPLLEETAAFAVDKSSNSL